ncbi:PqqD family protein [Emticicia sp. TH156]|nr:PqqD family protein [Emticicia sp. TH156]
MVFYYIRAIFADLKQYIFTVQTSTFTIENLQTKVNRNDEAFMVSGLGDEAVMMNLATGDFLGLNPVAADIWELTAQQVTIEYLIEQLLEKYDIDAEVCTTETLAYLQEMQKENMLIIAG